METDAVIFPAKYLGELVEAKRLRPMRESALNDKLFNGADVLPLVRQKLITYGGISMAMPLSVEMPLFGYREDWLAAGKGSPPSTWAGYHQMQSRLRAQPVAWPPREATEFWPAIQLLARSAGFACHPQNESVLFDPRTMSASIGEPPFVRALDEWQHETKLLSNERLPPDPVVPGPSDPPDTIVWADLPGALEAYNRSTAKWEPTKGGSRRVPLLAGGSLVAVTSSTRNAASAFTLAAWLASPEIGGRLISSGGTALPCRRSQTTAVKRWIDASGGQRSASKIAFSLEATLRRETCLVVPQIPGIDQYLAALAAAVEKALRGEASAADALGRAAQEWDMITHRLGRDSQRRAYLKHVGIVEP
jgi:ABC-type glycerol-3-phosphate transport system substrate-binding protein